MSTRLQAHAESLPSSQGPAWGAGVICAQSSTQGKGGRNPARRPAQLGAEQGLASFLSTLERKLFLCEQHKALLSQMCVSEGGLEGAADGLLCWHHVPGGVRCSR